MVRSRRFGNTRKLAGPDSRDDGRFEFDIDNGSVSYAMTESYRGSLLSKEGFSYILSYAAWAIDKFYKKFDNVINGRRRHKEVIEELLK